MGGGHRDFRVDMGGPGSVPKLPEIDDRLSREATEALFDTTKAHIYRAGDGSGKRPSLRTDPPRP